MFHKNDFSPLLPASFSPLFSPRCLPSVPIFLKPTHTRPNPHLCPGSCSRPSYDPGPQDQQPPQLASVELPLWPSECPRSPVAALISAWEALLPKSRQWPVVDEAACWRHPIRAGHSESGHGWSGKVTSPDSRGWSGLEHLLSAWRLPLQGHETPWLMKVNNY